MGRIEQSDHRGDFGKKKGKGDLLDDTAAPAKGYSSNLPDLTYFQKQQLFGQSILYPNPVQDDLGHIVPEYWFEKEPVRFSTYDHLGEEFLTFELSEPQTVIEVSALRVGDYSMRFHMRDGKIVTERFVKVD